VQVAELAPADPELDAPEPVRTDLDSRPRPDGRADPLSRADAISHELGPR
jgi:hypothetical protein